jgi:hypothetical protein
MEEISLLPRQNPPASAPDMPNPWLPTSTLAMARVARTAAAWAKAREEHRLATTKDQVKRLLGEYTFLNFFSPDPKHNVRDAINNFLTTQHFDWPNKLIAHIKQVMGTPCSTPWAPEFKFKLLGKATKHNLIVLEKYNYDLGRALNAQQDSPLGPGKEFKPPDVLQLVFDLHPLWKCMEDFLTHGSKWLLVEISEEERVNNLNDALTFGNHKGTSAKPELLLKLISKDVKYGYSVPIPLDSVKLIPGLEMAPMNIMAQKMIDEFRPVIAEDQLTHDQSWKWFSGTSVNSRVRRELLQECCFGFCIRQIVNWAVAARKKYPGQRILASKIDYKSAYRQGILHFATALRTAMQLLDNAIAIITFWLTFGGAPCPFKWGIMSETLCDLENELLKCKDWNSKDLHALVQWDILPWQYLDDNVPFASGRKLIVKIPIDPRGYTDIYIDDTMGPTIHLPGMMNAEHLEAAIPFAIEVAACPNGANEPIPCKKMVAEDKLTAEGGLTETKVILGWHFNFRTLTITLPKHKYIAWSQEIQQMMKTRWTTKKPLELIIGRMGHVGFVIPWVYHFLSRLRSLRTQAQKKRTIIINEKCMRDLELMQGILDKAKHAINMNLLAFRPPDHIYYSDSCPASLGGYSNQGHAWHFKVQDNLQFRASNNLFTFLAAIITPWIDIIGGCLSPIDCAIFMTDSTTAEGWMKKSNFVEPNDNPIQAMAYVDAARKYASIFMNSDIKGYSQWFARKLNNFADMLLRDWHRNNEEITYILRSHIPKQMPENFYILPLPSKINSWLTLVLRQLPMSKQLREKLMTMGLKLGSGGSNIATVGCDNPYLDRFSQIKQNLMLGAFAMAIREGRFTQDCTEPLVEGTVQGAISNVVQAFWELGQQNPTKDTDNMLSIFLSWQFRAYQNNDPKQVQQKALPFAVLEELAKRQLRDPDKAMYNSLLAQLSSSVIPAST